MSECVVRMEMPRRCCDCDMANGLTCMATGGTYGRDVPKMTWIRGKPDWCPILCSLPEGHGRLVDADELKAKKYHSDITHENAVAVAEIDWMPTIVPADTAERSET